MRVAAPMASSFVLWLLGLSATLFSFNKIRSSFANSSFGRIMLYTVFAAGSIIFTFSQSGITSFAIDTEGFDETVAPNYPIGEAKGINPGRVVWVWNPDATNENCSNSYTGEESTWDNGGIEADDEDDGWFLDKNNDQDAIDEMLAEGIKKLTNEDSDANAWDAVFRHFNKGKIGEDRGYVNGERIFIKINATSTWGKGQFWGNISDNYEHLQNSSYGIAETSPHLILSLLRQLVNVYGVDENDIYVGDPLKFIYQNSYDKWYGEFPQVHYVAYEGGGGREAVIPTESEIIKYSDLGSDMSGAVSDKIYTAMADADYLINVPTLKAHARAGVTLFAKNHFGSHTRENAEHLHPGLVAENNAQPTRLDSGMYRVQVDLMGHEKFGGNQVIFLLDALWAGSEATDPPTKWEMEPFNRDWTSSIFLSQDPVAIESVAFDFLYTEYDGSFDFYYRPKVNYPHMTGTTDYLRQAASSEYWPEGVIYDPEDDGTPIGSLGVNEHWNNPIDKQYSRNLGTGEGIELLFVDKNLKIMEAPSSLAAEVVNETEVQLTWIDNAVDEDGYIIERKENDESSEFQAIDTVAADVTEYLDASEKTALSYVYRIYAFNSTTNSDYSQLVTVDVLVDVAENGIFNEYKLEQNYPNPFNPSTTISFSLRERSDVKLEIYDLNGRLIKDLVRGQKEAGAYSIIWNGINFRGEKVASGNYIYKLSINTGINNIVKTRKMTLLK
jgi:hypothetical protein